MKLNQLFLNKSLLKLSMGIFVSLFIGCQIEPMDIPPDPIIPDIDVDTIGPKSTGFILSCFGGNPSMPFDYSVLPNDYPVSFDLSDSLPPVGDQGGVGSCTAWATTYYLKSYQEKIQHHSLYDASTIMSPSFVYNQTKAGSDCDSGACLIGSLEFLRTRGAVPLYNFGYSPYQCSDLPTATQLSTWQTYKIASYHPVRFTDSGTDDEVITKAKKLIYDGKPLVIAIALDKKFVLTTPRNADNIFIYSNYDATIHFGNHAMLIVGYDDTLKAFKTVNSWGKGWGHDGFCWISYDFFKKQTDPDYKIGLHESWFAIDE